MDAAKTLLRTAVRTFFNHPKQILIIDALLLHSVLHIDDLAILLSSQPKDIRSFINPLRGARLLTTQQRLEARAGSNRGVQRDYYYIHIHPAIDAIKYRIAKLRRKVESLYQQDQNKRKDWRCPRCKAEYEDLEILDKVNAEGFYCDRCGGTLQQNEAAAKESGNHEKIRKLNIQLAKFDEMIAKVDRAEVPENDWLSAWERKKEVPRPSERGYGAKTEYVELQRENRNATAQKRQEVVSANNLSINLTTGEQMGREQEEAKEKRKQELAKQNQLPDWHTKSAIGLNPDSTVKSEQDAFIPKKEEDEDKKVNLEEATMQDEVAAYMAEMERERQEAERKAKEEDDEDDDEDEDEFEDVVGTSMVGTPASSSQQQGGGAGGGDGSVKQETTPRTNGIKRELYPDGDSVSGTDTNANTPAESFDREAKRVKFENGIKSENIERSITSAGHGNNGTAKQQQQADSDEDEDFEDAM